MSDIAIRVENLGKKYRIGKRERYQTLRDSLTDAVSAPFRRIGSLFDHSQQRESPTLQDTVWALKDVSFDIPRGEVVGVIGRNGAGKSTLLKVLSRITEPTEGRAEIRGKVGSLLEVGTGFHAELTGRENTYLNGAILGMRRADITRKYDEIVAFADLEKFADTPVKHYSTGMYMRLAFAVAAHLDPDILIVDEVLAVGDSSFQKKCLARMGEVSRQGRTVLFVSHNMTAIRTLCGQVIWLSGGRVNERGDTEAVSTNYLRGDIATNYDSIWPDPHSAPGNDAIKLHRVRLTSPNGADHMQLTTHTAFTLQFWYWNLVEDATLNVSVFIYNSDEVCIFNVASPSKVRPVGLILESCDIPKNLLNDGCYSVRLLLVRNRSQVLLSHSNVLSFEVHDSEREGGGWFGKWPGAVRPSLTWRSEMITSDQLSPKHEVVPY